MDQAQQNIEERVTRNPITHEMYNHILLKCFDACIGALNDKILLKAETACMETCSHNYLTQTKSYQLAQQYYGFSEREEPIPPVISGTDKLKINSPGIGGGIL